MDWQVGMIASNKQTIAELSDAIEFLESGKAQFRSMVDGVWVVTNDTMIEQNRRIIGTLTEQNERLSKGESQ